MESLFDVAIIGGGPAGSSTAILLAGKGRKVIVLEKEKFPRFHIGESLLPYSMGAFDRLGIHDRLKAEGMPKYGGEIATACGARTVKFYFKNGFRLQHHQAYQVERATFDRILLDRARECGAEIREEHSVEKVTFGSDDVTLSIRSEAGTSEIKARYVVDCSGRNSVVGRQFGLKVDYPDLRKFSCFAHYEDVQRDEGIDAGLTRLVRADDHWFWLIPLDERRTSIGIVMDSADFKARKLSPEETLAAAIDASAVMRERMNSARRVTQVYSIGDYSYRNSRLAGDRWMLAGDAAGFIDPIFSTGVFLAIHSGEQCADAIDAALAKPGRRAKMFRRYERGLHGIMDMYLRFVSAWYRDEFIEVFTTPTERLQLAPLQLAPAINAVLAGNIGNSFAIWWRMQLFYLILFLQRYFPLCPRLESRTEQQSSPQMSAAA
jgi:flavin-dependent dehydrogenase